MPSIDRREQARVAPVDDVTRIVSYFVGVRWPIAKSDVPDLVDALGWTPEPPLLDDALVANTRWPLNRPEADLSCDNGELTTVSFFVTDVVRDDLPWRGDFLNDAFAEVVTAFTGLIGRPAGRMRVPNKNVWWEMANGGRFSAGQIENSVFVSVISAEWAEVNRRIGA